MNKTDKMILLGVKLYRQKHYLCARIIHFFLRLFRQCDISVEADISDNVHFCHKGFGIVINPNCKIGGGTVIQHCVTLGELYQNDAPKIGKNVFIGARAIVLGNVVIGDNSKIGAGAVVICDVPENSTVVGVPAHIVRRK